MPYLERDGVKIHYETHGDGPPLLLCHGYTVTSQMWEPQIPELSKRHRVVTFDLRGHGRSDSPADPALYAASFVVQDMAALLDEVGADRAAVGGHSLGGYLALAFHLHAPRRVAALLLCDTGPGYRKDDAREAWNRQAEAAARSFEERGLEALPHFTDAMRFVHRSAEGLARAGHTLTTQRDASVLESLPGIEVPTLVLVGAEDAIFRASADYMAAKIPGATRVVIEDAGHLCNIDRPEAFNRHVLGFLAGVEA